MSRFAAALQSAAADGRLARMRPFLSGVLSWAQPANLQHAADLLGSGATRCQEAGHQLESTALRELSKVALAGFLEEHPSAYEDHVLALEQLMVRLLELEASPADAFFCAQRGYALAEEQGDTFTSRRLASACSQLQAAMLNTGPTAKPQFTSVDRRGDLSIREFLTSYSEPGKPVIVRSPESSAACSFQELRLACQNRPLQQQQFVPGGKVWASMVPRAETTLPKLLQHWQRGDRECQVFDEPISSACPDLLPKLQWPLSMQDIDVVARFPGRGTGELDPFFDHPSLFVQPAGSRCGVHVDAGHSQFVQMVLCGRKLWSFWPIDLPGQLRWLGRRDQVTLEVREDEEGGFSRQVHHEQLFPAELATRPQGGRGVPERVRVNVEVAAGEAIFVPGGLPHSVANLEDSIAVSQNFVDENHALRAAEILRWPLQFHGLADFLQEAASVRG